MVNRVPITKARINLGQLAKSTHLKIEYFILEKDGIPVLAIMDVQKPVNRCYICSPPHILRDESFQNRWC